jgi:putrescine aminotransferase
MMTSANSLNSAKSAFWHCQANMQSVDGSRLVFVRGEGNYLWDADGKKYFDGPASLWYCNIGHGRTEIADAVARQIGRLESYSSFGSFTTDVTLALADRIASLLPIPDAKVMLTSGGSDGIDLAAKLARRYWAAVGHERKKVVVTRDLAYHGLHAFGTSITGLLANQEGLGKFVPDSQTVPTNDVSALRTLFEARGDEIAAFMAEPVMGTGGVIHPPAGYFDEVRSLCDEFDVLLVADEVITGFGRLGEWFGSTKFNIRPDIVVMAKGVSSGYLPLGAVAANARVSEPFWGPGAVPFRHGMTYAGHSAACAAGIANLDVVENEGLIARVKASTVTLDRAAQTLAGEDGVLEVRSGVGLMAGIQLSSPNLAEDVSRRCLADGFIVRPITNGTLQLSPPFTTTDDEIDGVVANIAANLRLALSAGLVPVE